jgi:hypothetical protein
VVIVIDGQLQDVKVLRSRARRKKKNLRIFFFSYICHGCYIVVVVVPQGAILRRVAKRGLTHPTLKGEKKRWRVEADDRAVIEQRIASCSSWYL